MQVTSLHIYPIKSLGGISLSSARISDRGFEHDRRWMLVDEKGEFITQRSFPQMALVDVQVMQDHLLLTHRQDGFTPLQVPMKPEGTETLRVKVWSSSVKALESSPAVSAAFSAWLGQPVRLVYMPDDSVRISNPRVVNGIEKVSLADGYPYLIIGEGTLADLNSRLADPVPMNRFRPNIVFSDGAPFAEDTWDTFHIGEAVFRAVKPCGRCMITTIDQSTALAGKEPLRTLAGYRTVNSNVMFGQNLICEAGEMVQVGDSITLPGGQ